MDVPEHLHQHVAQLLDVEIEAAIKRCLWAVVLGLRPFRDGTQWCVLWGPNIQEGIAGFGPSPEAAMFAFDSAVRTHVANVPEVPR